SIQRRFPVEGQTDPGLLGSPLLSRRPRPRLLQLASPKAHAADGRHDQSEDSGEDKSTFYRNGRTHRDSLQSESHPSAEGLGIGPGSFGGFVGISCTTKKQSTQRRRSSVPSRSFFFVSFVSLW